MRKVRFVGKPVVLFAIVFVGISRLLSGGLGGWGRRMRKARFARGWNGLTPEERQRFRDAMGPRHPGNFGEGEAAERG
jgi:hypothetical protein